jgi:hypothetical protein
MSTELNSDIDISGHSGQQSWLNLFDYVAGPEEEQPWQKA